MTGKIERAIRESPLFKHLSEPHFDALLEASSLVKFPPGEQIVCEDAPVEHFFIVLSGRVRVWTTGPRGEVELKTMGPGAYFGEVSLISGNSATATVEVKDAPAECVAVDRDHLIELIDADEKLRKILQGVTIARARDMIGKVFQ